MAHQRVIALDAGGTKLLGGVVDESMSVHHRVRRAWPGRDRGHVLDAMATAAEEARAAAPDAFAVGIGVPALLDASRSTTLFSNHLSLEQVPFREVMSERVGLPVFVDNDANAAMLAEHRFGAAQGAGCAVMLTLGTGIGGALVIDGRLFRGGAGAGAELGHVVVDANGPDCFGRCPGRGCLEAVASGSALGRDGLLAAREEPGSDLGAALADGREITGELVTELAHAGDPVSRRLIVEAGRLLGAGIAGIVNVFNPEVVVVGGGVIAAGELLLAPAREETAARALPPARDAVRIEPARFGDEAGMLGAAVLALGEAA